MSGIFISYRREDTEGQAGRLFDDLRDAFGADAVFMDVAGIEPGVDFRKAIDAKIAACSVLLTLIGPRWVDLKGADGQRRIDHSGDFVRLETAAALRRQIALIPVLVQGARMPIEAVLPDDLKDLAYRNGVELTHARWDSDMQVLMRALTQHVPPRRPEPVVPVAGSSGPVPATDPAVRPGRRRWIGWGAAAAAGLLAGLNWLSGGSTEPEIAPEPHGTVTPAVVPQELAGAARSTLWNCIYEGSWQLDHKPAEVAFHWTASWHVNAAGLWQVQGQYVDRDGESSLSGVCSPERICDLVQIYDQGSSAGKEYYWHGQYSEKDLGAGKVLNQIQGTWGRSPDNQAGTWQAAATCMRG